MAKHLVAVVSCYSITYMCISYLGASIAVHEHIYCCFHLRLFVLTQRENLLTNAKEVLKRKNSVVPVLFASQLIENLHGNAEIGSQYI